MNIYLLRLIGNWLGTVCLSILSLFGATIQEERIQIQNTTIDNTTTIVSTITENQTVEKYNKKLPSGEFRVLVEGNEGITYIDSNGTQQELRPVVNRVVEIGTGPSSDYIGNTTGYGADCIGCSGNVACRTKEGATHNLVNDGMYYNDSQYGRVRILAADHRVFPCGTIIEINNGRLDSFLGIVLDTGIDMRKNWEQFNLIHIDVAFITEKDPDVFSMTASNQSAQFDVQRWGW